MSQKLDQKLKLFKGQYRKSRIVQINATICSMNLLAICLRIERDLSSLILTKMVLLIALIKQYVIVSSKKIKIKSNTTVINQKKKKTD